MPQSLIFSHGAWGLLTQRAILGAATLEGGRGEGQTLDSPLPPSRPHPHPSPPSAFTHVPKWTARDTGPMTHDTASARVATHPLRPLHAVHVQADCVTLATRMSHMWDTSLKGTCPRRHRLSSGGGGAQPQQRFHSLSLCPLLAVPPWRGHLPSLGFVSSCQMWRRGFSLPSRSLPTFTLAFTPKPAGIS